MPYLRRVFRLPAELEEVLVAELWEAGTLGTETATEADPAGRVRLTAWFAAAGPPAPAARPAEPEAAPAVPDLVELLSEEVLPDADWMADYRRRAVPFPLGRTLQIDPREPDEAAREP